MKHLGLIGAILPLVLLGCSGGGEPESTADSVNDMETRGPFVEVLPSYESELLPEGLIWETNETDPVFASDEAKRGGHI